MKEKGGERGGVERERERGGEVIEEREGDNREKWGEERMIREMREGEERRVRVKGNETGERREQTAIEGNRKWKGGKGN
jgi:hypothetical protein